MQKSLNTINEILAKLFIPPINEETAKAWEIEGGESYNECFEMAKCYAGEIEQSKIERSYYLNSKYN